MLRGQRNEFPRTSETWRDEAENVYMKGLDFFYLKSSIRYLRKEKEVNVQNINGKFSDVIYTYRIRCL
jgi:hypothetical protein